MKIKRLDPQSGIGHYSIVMTKTESFCFCVSVILLLTLLSCSNLQPPADLVLRDARIYTLEEDLPWASAIIITGNRIQSVLETDSQADAFIGPETRVFDLDGAFVLPGIIDGHTHFDSAGALLNDANLLMVSDDEGLRKELKRVADLVGKDEWITGGSWGAYETWALGSSQANSGSSGRWQPNRIVIDELTPDNPVFVRSFDRELYLANSLALEISGLLNSKSLAGMQKGNDGKPTGLIYKDSPALQRIRQVIQPKSEERRLSECRAALREIRQSGIVEIHDITDEEQMELFVQLQEKDELTTRVWMRADLSRAQEFKDKGYRLNHHPRTGRPDHFLRWGAFKGYIDGIMGNHTALFFQPYNDQPQNYGTYRHHTSSDPEPPYLQGDMEKMYRYLKIAQEAGFPANVHAIGTKGVALMLDTYERLMEETSQDLDGYRVIHCQVVRPSDFPRFQQLNVAAEINPYHLSDDMRWMEERIGHDRCQGAYAFQSLLENGAKLIFGSDWPGTNAAYYHIHPKYLIHAAVNRTTINHQPANGWFPNQKISVEEAIKAYTINGAEAAFEGDWRGTLKPGKLADITVLDQNLFEIPPEKILDTEVLMTVVDGKIVYRK